MFGRRCPNCNRKIGKDFDFCSYCGFNLQKREQRDTGLLDEIDESLFNAPFNFGSLFKEIDRQFRDIDSIFGRNFMKEKKTSKTELPFPFGKSAGISVSISTASGNKPEIKIRTFGLPQERIKKMAEITNKRPIPAMRIISEKEHEKLAKLPRKEPETKVRRLTDKIIYEVELPGVEDIKDVVINKLENSIEIKAFTKDRAYFKLIPVSLPLRKYQLKEEKLILELSPIELNTQGI